jgi:hypothetical protein
MKEKRDRGPEKKMMNDKYRIPVLFVSFVVKRKRIR